MTTNIKIMNYKGGTFKTGTSIILYMLLRQDTTLKVNFEDCTRQKHFYMYLKELNLTTKWKNPHLNVMDFDAGNECLKFINGDDDLYLIPIFPNKYALRTFKDFMQLAEERNIKKENVFVFFSKVSDEQIKSGRLDMYKNILQNNGYSVLKSYFSDHKLYEKIMEVNIDITNLPTLKSWYYRTILSEINALKDEVLNIIF